MNRRNFLLGAGVTLVAAPAIVRVASIMPVKAVELAEAPVLRWVAYNDFIISGYSYEDEISYAPPTHKYWRLVGEDGLSVSPGRLRIPYGLTPGEKDRDDLLLLAKRFDGVARAC